jgi:hypothetical protein
MNKLGILYTGIATAGLLMNAYVWTVQGFQLRHLFFTPFGVCLLIVGILMLRVQTVE